MYTTIRRKIKALINLIFFLVHDHSTKVRGHSYFLIYYFFNCANISFAILKAVVHLYFVCSIHWGAALTLIFRTLYWWKCCSYISYAESMAIWSLGHSYLRISFATGKNAEIWGLKWLVFSWLYNFLMCSYHFIVYYKFLKSNTFYITLNLAKKILCCFSNIKINCFLCKLKVALNVILLGSIKYCTNPHSPPPTPNDPLYSNFEHKAM